MLKLSLFINLNTSWRRKKYIDYFGLVDISFVGSQVTQ